MDEAAESALRSVREAVVDTTPIQRAHLVVELLEEVHRSIGGPASREVDAAGPEQEKRELEVVIAAARAYAQRATRPSTAGSVDAVARRPGGVADSGNINLEMQYRSPTPFDAEPVTITQVQLLRLLQTISQACEYDTPNRPQLGAAWAFLTAVHTRDIRDSPQLEDDEWQRLNAMPIIPPAT